MVRGVQHCAWITAYPKAIAADLGNVHSSLAARAKVLKTGVEAWKGAGYAMN